MTRLTNAHLPITEKYTIYQSLVYHCFQILCTNMSEIVPYLQWRHSVSWGKIYLQYAMDMRSGFSELLCERSLRAIVDFEALCTNSYLASTTTRPSLLNVNSLFGLISNWNSCSVPLLGDSRACSALGTWSTSSESKCCSSPFTSVTSKNCLFRQPLLQARVKLLAG